MRWTVKPLIGSRWAFAWLPRRVGNTMVWLERYVEKHHHGGYTQLWARFTEKI